MLYLGYQSFKLLKLHKNQQLFIYENFNLISILDSTNNWILNKSELLFYDEGKKTFFTPSYPKRKISILHFTNMKFDEEFKCRNENNIIINKKISNLDG